jgi:hippurate hydrolase
MLIGQPAEERGAGAALMLKDGLFNKFARPDFAVALHVDSSLAAGKIAMREGYGMANVDSVDITIKGRGGHGAYPHTTIDPVVIAARLVLDLQTIVSREIKPIEPAVITVGSIQGGVKHNIIGDDCKLQLTVRSYTDEVRAQLKAGIERKTRAAALSAGAPQPEISFSEGTPSLYNDPQLAGRLRKVFNEEIGESNVETSEPSMGGEDFSQYGRAGVPILMYRVGAVVDRRLNQFTAQGRPAPSLHSPQFYPDPQETLTTAFRTMTAAALDILAPTP